uniref:Glycosyltransferase n=1 Tax=Arnebia euchroma TaxID=373122 RepID=A0A899K087_ARNEU|nr:glycosyltransferase [Arnebia euchroma]
MGEDQLHIMFFPFMAAGHIIPTLDMVKLFSSRGNVKITLVITHSNSSMVAQQLENQENINFKQIEFPDQDSGLPKEYDTVDKIKGAPELFPKFLKALELMQNPFEKILQEFSPDCLVADMFYPWATNAAAKFDIPRLVFHGVSLFALCGSEVMRRDKPFKNVSSDTEHFVIPNIPHEIVFTRQQLSDTDREEFETDMTRLMRRVLETDKKSYGILINSFLELDPVYTEYYKTVFGRRAWNIGPLLLCRRQGRELQSSGDDNNVCLRWLDGKKPNSVIYLCFGSGSVFTTAQLQDIAFGLEAAGQQFIWVVRQEVDENWLPEGFEEKILSDNRGLIIKGWAPQVRILEHKAVGAFLTHCGWNSILEAICAGVPMVTWPLFAEQFYNERFVTRILGIGIPVGAPKYGMISSGVSKEAIAKALKAIMEGEKALEVRNKANESKKMAWKAVEKGGSSYNELSALLEEIRQLNR